MLNEFAGIWKVSDESLGRDETPRHTSHENFNFLQCMGGGINIFWNAVSLK